MDFLLEKDMRILHLSLTNFRNYSRLELELPPGVVLLQGDNAQGKTNLLEAIYYLSRVRSPRTSLDRELINWLALEDDLPFARLVAKAQKGEEVEQIELSLVQANETTLAPQGGTPQSWRPETGQAVVLRKHVRVNGAAKRALDAVGLLNVVLFLPEDINLVSGPPHLRRRYLDDTIGQVDPEYRRELQRYERVLTQRNCLLKSLRGYANDSEQLLFWDQHVVEHGAYIIVRRQQVLEQLDQIVQRIHLQLTGEKEHLRLRYCASVDLESRPGAARQIALPIIEENIPPQLQNVATLFADQLRQVRSRELEQGMSIVGPHRDDFRFLVNGMDMNIYGSRGQQRTIALSMKLAEVEWIAQEKNDKPVLLLDDVFSELDAPRRHYLTQAIDQAQQVIITTTDLSYYDPEFLARAALWQVCGGRLEKLIPSPEAAS